MSDLSYQLSRMADYNTVINETDRALLRAAAAAVDTPGDDMLTDAAIPHWVGILSNLLVIVADPNRAAQVVGQMQAVVDAAHDSQVAADAAVAALDAARASIGPELETTREKAAHEIAVERGVFEKKVQEVQRGLTAREAAVLEREQQTSQAADEVAAMRADLAVRIERIRSAAA
jgi:hypothetical protein